MKSLAILVVWLAVVTMEPLHAAVIAPAEAGDVFVAPHVIVGDAAVKPKETVTFVNAIGGVFAERNRKSAFPRVSRFGFHIVHFVASGDYVLAREWEIRRICQCSLQFSQMFKLDGYFLYESSRLSEVFEMIFDGWSLASGGQNYDRSFNEVFSSLESFTDSIFKIFFINDREQPRPFDTNYGGGGCNGGICGAAIEVKTPKEGEKSTYSYSNLNPIQPNGFFGGIGHASLFAQIGFIMALSFATFHFIPVGFDRLFPLNSDRVRNRNVQGWRRSRWRGAWLSLIGWGSLGLLIGIILSV